MIDLTVMHVVPRIHQESSGPTYSVTRLCESQAQLGANVELHVVKSAGQNVPLVSITEHGSIALSGKLLASPSLKRALSFDYGMPRVVHNHSLWMLPNIYPGKIPRTSTLVTSPRGTMSDWAWNRSYWTKRFAWWIGQKQTLSRSDCFHATAVHECDDIRKRGFRQPVAIIPNGIDVPEIPNRLKNENQRTLLFLARLHPVKGIENLMRAWRSVGSRHPDWILVIAGGGSPTYERQLRELAESLHVERLEFCGSVYGNDKTERLAGADLYVLPSFTENFGVSVAEAMACGTPVITTDQTPWTMLAERNAGWCIAVGENALAECLDHTLCIGPDRLAEMGRSARQWMLTDYSWNEIAKKTLNTYQWLAGQSERPDWIRD